MKTLIFTLITLSFAFSHAGRIDNYYREVARTGKIHRPHRIGMPKPLTDIFDRRSFYKAVRDGNIAKVKDSLDRQEIDPNAPSPFSNEPPLYDAAMGGNKEMVELLLTHPGINPNIRNISGYTILQMYSFTNSKSVYLNVVEAILKHHKTDPNIKSKDGFAPLHTAANKANSRMTRLLLTHPRINPNVTNDSGFTPLHIAALRGDTLIVKSLLNHPQTNLHLRNKFGDTALEAALSRGHKETAEVIRKHQE